MDRVFLRRLLFSGAPLTGCYRYKDVFQLTPAPADAPRPPYVNGDYPLILELQFDPRIEPEREDDFWHRDVWERVRDNELGGSPWLDEQIAAHREMTSQRRGSAIVKEITVLLNVLTNHRFFQYESTGVWTRPAPALTNSTGGVLRRLFSRKWQHPKGPTDTGSDWRQLGYALSLLNTPSGGFSTLDVAEIPLAPMGKYYNVVPDTLIVGQDFHIQLPEAIDALLNKYFALDAELKHAFYAACHLWGQFGELRSTAPSMALVAAASAIETLANLGDSPEAANCPECGTPSSIEKCSNCGVPRYRLTSRFRNFMLKYAGTESGQLANKLYRFRGNISHAGDLLRQE